MYKIFLQAGWDTQFSALDKSVQMQILKKIEQMKEKPPRKHLKDGLGYFVEKVGQYRIVFVSDEKEMAKYVYFVGDHKNYNRWLGTR